VRSNVFDLRRLESSPKREHVFGAVVVRSFIGNRSVLLISYLLFACFLLEQADYIGKIGFTTGHLFDVIQVLEHNVYSFTCRLFHKTQGIHVLYKSIYGLFEAFND
jgi:hypothetical protein